MSKLTAEALKLFMVLSTVHLWLIKGHPACKFPFLFVCRFFQFFDQLKRLRMWKMQLLDEHHLFIKYTSEDVVTLRVTDPSQVERTHRKYDLSLNSSLSSLCCFPQPLSLCPLLFVLCNRNSSFRSPRIRLSYRFCSVLNWLWQQIDLINAQFIFKKCHIWLLS